MKFEFTETQSLLVDSIQNAEGTVWVVGGAVRDLHLGRVPKDIDFSTDLLPRDVRKLAKDAGFTVIPDVIAFQHGTVKVVDKTTGDPIDITTLRRDTKTDGRHAEVEFTTSLRDDLCRRDLTINALAAKVKSTGEIDGTLFDHHHGQVDLNDKSICFIGVASDRIIEDAVRMVRACRFTALGEDWKLHSSAHEAIHSHREYIRNISKERIRDEIVKGLMYPKPSNFFRALQSTELLEIIFPDLQKGVGVEQNEHHAEPVFDHLVRCLDFSVSLTDSPMLRLATLCHDIAKPHTRSVGPDGKVHFYKHEVVGATLMYNWMKEYKFSNSEIEYVSKLVRHHQWRFEKTSKDKTIRKWLNSVGKDVWRDLITLRCADRKGNLKKADLPMMTSHMLDLIARAERLIDTGPVFQEDLAINGHDIKELGIKPGKIYKQIFTDMMGLVINEPSKNTREQLLEFVAKNYLRNENHETT